MKPRLAITGATGFVGKTLLKLANTAGHDIRALTRKPQPERPGVTWIEGALDQPDSLARLVHGVDAIIHVAGVVNAPNRDGFIQGNIAGTEAMLAAAQSAGVGRFVHVSSLAARAPDLSVYGWSKAGAEHAVAQSRLTWAMVRPPWVYGPGDMDTLDMFRMAKSGLVLVPPEGAVSLIHAEDLSRLLLALAAPEAPHGQIFEADDNPTVPWTNRSVAQAIAQAVGRRALVLSTPRPLLKVGAQLDRLFRGDGAKLTQDRVAYFCHPDWRIDATKRPAASLWRPQIETPAGLRSTAESYRTAGLL